MSRHNLRTLTLLSLVGLSLLLVGCTPTAQSQAAPAATRPNILLILADDLDLELGALDYMPNLKRLIADQGATLADFFVTNSLCCPSRATILRGQYTHSHHTYTNQPPYGGYEAFVSLGMEGSTLATWLQAGGYTTALMGKYMNGYPLTGEERHIPPGWSEWLSPAGGVPYNSYNYQMNENGVLVSYGRQSQDYITDVLADKADSFIRRAVTAPTPFFLYLAPYAPHSPANPAPRHANLFPEVQAPRTPSFNEADVRDKPRRVRMNALLTVEEIQALDELYRNRLRSLQAVDEMIARLVATLDETGELDNTYIIFTSDNGYHMGQHRLPDGKAMAYEEDIHVPFIIRGPGIVAGAQVSGLSGNVDIAPTLADIADVATPGFVEGRSLLPLWITPSTLPLTWRQGFLVEQYPLAQTTSAQGPNPRAVGLVEPADGWSLSETPTGVAQTTPTAIYIALRTMHYTYVEWNTGERELYDLLTDPYQLDNQAVTASPVLLAMLSTWVRAFHTCQGASCRSLDAGTPVDVTDTPTATTVATVSATATARATPVTPSPTPTVVSTPTRSASPTPTPTPTSTRPPGMMLFLPLVS